MKKEYILISLFSSLTLFAAEKDNCPNCREKITQLKEKHAVEIAWYEKKIADLMATQESLPQKDQQQRVLSLPSTWKVEDLTSKK